MSNVRCQTCKKPLEITRPHDVLDPAWRGRQHIEYHGIGDCVSYLADRVARLETRTNLTEPVQRVVPTVVVARDNEGLYIDGKLWLNRSYHDSMTDFEVLMDRLGLEFELVMRNVAGALPDKLSDLK